MADPFSLRFLESSPHGVIAGVCLPPHGEYPMPSLLTVEEREHVASLAPLRRVPWIGGRVALRHAAQHLGWQLGTVLSTPRGAPDMPSGIIGSIAHKSHLAVALVDLSPNDSLGIDIEEVEPPRPKIARLVLRPEERALVDALPSPNRWNAIITRFSMKEALFKAIDPYLQRYVGFQEASIDLWEDHRAKVHLHLKTGKLPLGIEARWSTLEGHVLTTVRTRRE